MSKVLVTESYLNNIAEAIRAKNGAATTYRPGDMAAAIQAIPTGGITPTGTKNIAQNGTHDVTQYASANVNVPNSYAAGDEGKVVSNGALVAQTSRNIAANGTYDTTTNDEVVVSVAPNLQSKTVTENGTVTPDQGYDGLSSVVVNVSGGGASGIYVGRDAPSASLGSDGDYYYRRDRGINGFTGTLSSNSSTTISGNEFIPNTNINVAGLRGYVRANTTGRLLIADTAGAIIAELSNISFVAGWNRALFDTPIQLAANQNYIVAIEVGNTWLSYTNASNIQFDSSITYVRGRYGSIPGTQDAGIVYGADIIIDPGYEIVYEQYYKANGEWTQIG